MSSDVYITMATVAKHNTSQSAWIVIYDNVYDGKSDLMSHVRNIN